jgi:hypothetical protein
LDGFVCQIRMFRPIRVDHTNCLQGAIKTHSLTNIQVSDLHPMTCDNVLYRFG